jgi:hypothetical protein
MMNIARRDQKKSRMRGSVKPTAFGKLDSVTVSLEVPQGVDGMNGTSEDGISKAILVEVLEEVEAAAEPVEVGLLY